MRVGSGWECELMNTGSARGLESGMGIPCARRRAGEYQQMLECGSRGSKRESSRREFVDIKCERNLESEDAILLFVKRIYGGSS